MGLEIVSPVIAETEAQYRCSQCKMWKAAEEFASHRRRKSRDYKQSECRSCHSKLNRDHYGANHEYYVDKAAESRANRVTENRPVIERVFPKQCARCQDPITMDRYRRIARPGMTLSKHGVSSQIVMGWSVTRIITEMEYAEFVCTTCYASHRRTAVSRTAA